MLTTKQITVPRVTLNREFPELCQREHIARARRFGNFDPRERLWLVRSEVNAVDQGEAEQLVLARDRDDALLLACAEYIGPGRAEYHQEGEKAYLYWFHNSESRNREYWHEAEPTDFEPGFLMIHDSREIARIGFDRLAKFAGKDRYTALTAALCLWGDLPGVGVQPRKRGGDQTSCIVQSCPAPGLFLRAEISVRYVADISYTAKAEGK